MKIAVLKVFRCVSIKIGTWLINFISREQKLTGGGVRLYIKIMGIFFLPVLFFALIFYKIRIFSTEYIYKYHTVLNSIYPVDEYFIKEVVYIAVDTAAYLLIIAFVVWHRTTVDIVTQNIFNEFQEKIDNFDENSVEKQMVKNWMNNLECFLVVYNSNLVITDISRSFKRWFAKQKISTTLIGKNILNTPFCSTQKQKGRAIWAFDQDRTEIKTEEVVFNGKSYYFEITRKKFTNGNAVILMRLEEVSKLKNNK